MHSLWQDSIHDAKIICSLYTAQSLPLADKAGVANSSLPNLAVGIHGSLGCHVGCSNCGVVVLSHIHMMVGILCRLLATSHLWSCTC